MKRAKRILLFHPAAPSMSFLFGRPGIDLVAIEPFDGPKRIVALFQRNGDGRRPAVFVRDQKLERFGAAQPNGRKPVFSDGNFSQSLAF